MEFRQLNTFIHVAQFQSFSRAAEHLGYSQSAVTVQIRLLEQELGTRLFDRMGKQIRLTAQGEQFLSSANQILYEVNRATLSMQDDMELKNTLHIGTIESLSTAKLPPIIRHFRRHHPKVSIQITIASPEKLIEMMEHNELDLIYILDTPRWNANWYKALEIAEQIVFVASPLFDLAGKRDLSLNDLLEKPFFLTEKNANYRQLWTNAWLPGEKIFLRSWRAVILPSSFPCWSSWKACLFCLILRYSTTYKAVGWLSWT